MLRAEFVTELEEEKRNPKNGKQIVECPVDRNSNYDGNFGRFLDLIGYEQARSD